MKQEVIMVESAAHAAQLAKSLFKKSRIAVDLEFDKNRYRYGFNLCLMQIGTEEEVYLIDPLRDEADLKPIFDVLESNEVQKVVFEFGEDLRLLHNLGCRPENIYDLSYACKVLNNPQLSLANILDAYLGKSIDKDSQGSNWFKRPLSKEQVKYAALDVAYLLKLHDVLNAELNTELMQWVEEENTYLTSSDHAQTQSFLDVSKKHLKGLTEWDYGLLIALLEKREEIAKVKDRPTYQIARTEDLVKLVEYYQSGNKEQFKKLETRSKLKHLVPLLREAEKANEEVKRSKSRRYRAQRNGEDGAHASSDRKRRQSFIDDVLKPIQASIRSAYGEHVATFLLSNKNMKDIALSGCGGFPSYREGIYRDHAAKSGVDQAFDDYMLSIQSTTIH